MRRPLHTCIFLCLCFNSSLPEWSSLMVTAFKRDSFLSCPCWARADIWIEKSESIEKQMKTRYKGTPIRVEILRVQESRVSILDCKLHRPSALILLCWFSGLHDNIQMCNDACWKQNVSHVQPKFLKIANRQRNEIFRFPTMVQFSTELKSEQLST